MRELEEHGYVIRQRVRNPNGQLGAIEYTILEPVSYTHLDVYKRQALEESTNAYFDEFGSGAMAFFAQPLIQTVSAFRCV